MHHIARRCPQPLRPLISHPPPPTPSLHPLAAATQIIIRRATFTRVQAPAVSYFHTSTMSSAQTKPVYKSHQYLSDDLKKQSIETLQPLLASALDLKTQIKQAHWNVKGPSFIALHELFDKIAEESDEYVDNIAERINQLGGISEGTLRVTASRTQLKEYPLNISKGTDHAEALSSVMGQFGKLVRDGSAKIDESGDKGSADVLDDIADDLDKWIWFVEAHVQADA